MFAVIRSLYRSVGAMRSSFWLPVVLVLIAASILLFGADRPPQYWAVGEENEPILTRFHGNEQNETDRFRWSYPQATLFIYGYRGAPALIELRLAAPRREGIAPAQVIFTHQDGQLVTTTVAGYWRYYRFLLPTSTTGESFLRWSTEPYVAPPDIRELGLALSRVNFLTTVERPPLSGQMIGWAILPLLVWWAGTLWRWDERLRNILTGLALLPAIGLASFPVGAEYWLPSLPWPWWPLAPVLILALWPSLANYLQRLSKRITPQPRWSWFGIILAFAGLIAIRFGVPAWIALLPVISGVWLVWPLITDDEEGSVWPVGRSLLLITGIALATRLIALDQMPLALWRDESRHGLLALRVWTEPTFRPIYVVKGADLPALFFYLVAPIVGNWGAHAWSVRLVSALAGAFTPLALYWFASPLIGRRAAVLAAALLAWASWSLSMSRWAFPATLDHLLVLTAGGLLWRGLDPGQQYWRSWSYVVGAALLGGLAVYTYHTGRLAPLALLMVAVFRLGHDLSRWRRFWPHLLSAALVGAIVIAPLALYILNDSAGFNRRVGLVSIFQANDLTRHRPLDFLGEHIVRYGLMWHVQGDANGRHHLPLAPMVDPVVGLFLLIGLGLVWQARRQSVVVLFVLWLLYHVPGLLSFNAPHAMRTLGTLAPACALAGWGLSRFGSGREWQRWLIPSMLVLSLCFNLWVYFGQMRTNPRVYGEFDRVETVMAHIVRRAATPADSIQRVSVYLPREWALSDTVRFLTIDLPPAQQPKIWRGASDDENTLVVLPAFADATEVATVLQALGPSAIEVFPTPTLPSGSEPLVRVFARGSAAIELMRAP